MKLFSILFKNIGLVIQDDVIGLDWTIKENIMMFYKSK
jgi:hypothetical protein